MNIEKEVKLDQFKLDVEASKNPSYLAYYGEEAADARAERDKLSLDSKRIRAERELYYRRNPPDDIKVTEGVIASLVETDAQVQALEDKYLKAKEETAQLEAALDAFRDKSDMIKCLTTQFQTGYFAVAQGEKL
jgi:uncharacterized protein (DUF3084 family)